MDSENKIYTENILQPGEQVLWEGEPEPKIYLERADILLIPLSIYWCVFMAVWEILAFKMGVMILCVAGVGFLLIGLYLLVGRFFINERRLRSCRYLATDRRLIFINARGIDSIFYTNIIQLKKRERKDGVGTIFFGPFMTYLMTYAFQAEYYLGNAWRPRAFENIRKVDQVYDLIIKRTAERTGRAG